MRSKGYLRVPLWVAFGAAIFSLSLAGQAPPDPARGPFGMRMIVVATMGEAERLLQQLASGADFATLAREWSVEPTSVDGGYLGRIAPESLRSELRDAVKGLGPGRHTGAVKLPSGYAIVKILPDSDSPDLPNASPVRMLSASGTGAVYGGLSVGGLAEADAMFLGFPKADGWEQDLRGMCEIRTRSMSSILQRLSESQGAEDPAAVAPELRLDAMQTQYAWAQLHAYLGDMNAAISRWDVAKRIAEAGVPGAVQQMNETLGVAYLHKSELDNLLYRTPGDACLFPPPRASRLANTTASDTAIQYFLKYLERDPENLEVRWLLNLAYATVGGYPSAVPPRHLVPPSAFESKESIGRFTDVARPAGLNAYSLAGGAIVDDFDNDGHLDVVTSSMDVCEPMHFFHSNGDGRFTERTTEAGLGGQLGGLNLVQADYNNDGCLDILVLRGGWEFPMRPSLLKNNCNGTFTDVTSESGIGLHGVRTQTAAWADIDNDGAVDLFVGAEDGPSRLFRNTGKGTFEDISAPAGINVTGFIKAVVAADYDNDGHIDFYLSNYEGHNLLLHNNRNRTFTEVGKEAGVQAPWRSFAAWFFDYDNDGWQDLFVNSYYASVDESVRTYLAMPHNAEPSKLYRNLRNGTFRDVTKEAGLDKVYMPMAANFGDVDNDGYLDMYLGMGNPSYTSVLPHELLVNRAGGNGGAAGGRIFVNVTAASGTGELHKGHGIAFADLDRDGDEDITAEVGGAVPGDRHALRQFENPGNANDWLSLKLIGSKTNRAAMGARVTLTVENAGRDGPQSPRAIHRTIGSGGSFGANPMELHVGLGPSASVRSVEIWWPGSNTRQMFGSLPKNQFLEIRELAGDFTRLERKSFRLGGANR